MATRAFRVLFAAFVLVSALGTASAQKHALSQSPYTVLVPAISRDGPVGGPTPTPLPDLVATPGGQPDYLTYMNAGRTAIDLPDLRIHVYFSTDAVLDPATDCLVRDWTFGEWFGYIAQIGGNLAQTLAPGAGDAAPSLAGPGRNNNPDRPCAWDFSTSVPFYYIYFLDADLALAESNEVNNVVAKSSIYP